MALPSTINTWIEELANSVTPSLKNDRQKHKRAVDGLKRRLRHHNHGRTNQFDVHDQLEGLKEKFQILNRDDLSDALHNRMIELREHQNPWIPDVLDLLLRVSNNPVQKTRLVDVSTITASFENLVTLKWSDLEDEDTFDQHDSLWQNPNFSDLSSEEDETQLSTSKTSPSSVRCQSQIGHKLDDPNHGQIFQINSQDASMLVMGSLHATLKINSTNRITQIQLLRQILLMVQGYKSPIFDVQKHQIRPNRGVSCSNLSSSTLQALLDRLRPVCTNLDTITGWTARDYPTYLLSAGKQYVENAVQKYSSSIGMIDESLLQPTNKQVVSLLAVATQIERHSLPLATLARWIARAKSGDSIAHFDALYDEIGSNFDSNNTEALEVLLPMFKKLFDVYSRPIQHWIDNGGLEQTSQPFFVRSKDVAASPRGLWHDWFDLGTSGDDRPPTFLNDTARKIFASGKATTFINHITNKAIEDDHPHGDSATLSEEIGLLCSDSTIPFSTALTTLLETYFTAILASKTKVLMHLLESRCGMMQTLDAFEYIYLRRQGNLLDHVETRIFSRIDKFMDNWNDRFVVADMLEDVYHPIGCLNLESIKVHSAHTSSRSMESRRRSVRILNALAIDYQVPELVANIISQRSVLTYRQVSLLLSQIRRAKFVLERTAYYHVQSTAISMDPKDQLLAQATMFQLVVFTNTLYDHFTAAVIQPLTVKLRQDLQTVNDVDAAIAVHETYISTLAFVCLISKQLKVLQESLISLLDMCLRFADLVSTPTDAADGRRRHSHEFETSSFTSAQSRRSTSRRRRNARKMGVARARSRRKSIHDGIIDDAANRDSSEDDNDSDEDDDEYHTDEFGQEGEGYSSFIVLEDDTSIAKEIVKLRNQFIRQLDFFVVGLRGAGRAGGSSTGSDGSNNGRSGGGDRNGGVVVDQFELLADRLEWTKSRT